MRRKFRPGDYLIIDEVTGEEIWASQAAYDWDGSIRRADDLDNEHPDFFRKNYPEERQPDMVNAPVPVTAPVSSAFVGNTTVTAPPGPAPSRFLS